MKQPQTILPTASPAVRNEDIASMLPAPLAVRLTARHWAHAFVCLFLAMAVGVCAAADSMAPYLAENGKEIRFAEELQGLAAELGHEPARIYAWVVNNIEYSHYYYSRKGALATYRTGSGNTWDQASLLIALLRLSGIPARYATCIGSTHSERNWKVVFVQARLRPDQMYGVATAADAGAEWVPLVPWLRADTLIDAAANTGGSSAGSSLSQTDSLGMVTREAGILMPWGTNELPIPPSFTTFDDKMRYMRSGDSLDRNALEVFEGELQAHLSTYYPGKTLKDVLCRERLTAVTERLAPGSVPRNLSFLGLGAEPESFAEPPDSLRAQASVKLYRTAVAPDNLLLTKSLLLPEVADRRLTVDFENVSSALRPVLRLDGEVIAGASAPTLAVGATPPEFFVVEFTCDGLPPVQRPPHKAGTIVCLNLDLFSASIERGAQLKQEIAAMSPGSVLPSDPDDWDDREKYLGRVGAFLANQYFLRWREAIDRAHDLHQCRFDPWAAFTYAQIFLDPATITADTDGATPFGFLAAWNIDTEMYGGETTRLGSIPTVLDWDDPLAKSIRDLFMFVSSQNEGAIFEDWQGTHGLSTVGGMIRVLRDGGEVAEITKRPDGLYNIAARNLGGPVDHAGDNGNNVLTATELRNEVLTVGSSASYLHPYSAEPEGRADSLLGELGTGKVLTLPTNRVYLAFTVGDPAHLTMRTMQADVYMSEGPGSVGFLFAMDPISAPGSGGGTDFVLDAATTAHQGTPCTMGDGTFIPPDVTSDYTADLYRTFNITGEGQACAARYNVTSSGGDPVNLVNGEFYHDPEPDIACRSTGFDLAVVRRYRSRLGYDGPFGVGWAWNHAERIVVTNRPAGAGYEGNDLHYHAPDRTIHTIRRMTGGSYKTPPGADYVLVDRTGGGWELRRRDLTVVSFDSDGQLVEKRDLYGNTLAFVRDANGRLLRVNDRWNRSLLLSYGTASGKVERVTDPAGRSCFYLYGATDYDAFEGMLGVLDQAALANLRAALQRVIAGHAGLTTYADAVAFLGAAGDLVGFIDPAGSVTTYQYMQPADQTSQLCHNLSRCTLPNGDFLGIVYFPNDTVSSHTNAKGDTFHFAYSFYHRYAETWNEEGFYRKVYWNDHQDVTRMDNEDGCIVSMEYDPNSHDLVARIDANGNSTVFTYDGRRNLLTKSSGQGDWRDTEHWTATEILTYAPIYASQSLSDPGYYLVTSLVVTDPRGFQTTTKFTDQGKPEYVTSPPADDIVQRTKQLYDAYGNPDLTTQQWSAVGSETFTAVPHATVDKDYDATLPCLLTSVRDGYGAETRFVYDGSGLARIGIPLSVRDSQANYVHTRYNAIGQPTHITEPSPSAIGGPALPSTVIVYDINHRPVTTTAPDSGVTATVYDISRDIVTGAQVAASIDPLGYATCSEYDAVGNRVRATDRRGDTTSFTYDPLGRVASRADPLGGIRYFDYDGNGNLIRLTDEGGNAWEYAYDHANRKVSETDPDEHCTAYVYDASGNLVRETRSVADPDDANPVDVVTLFAYDARNRPVSKTVFGDANRNGACDHVPEAQKEESRTWTWEYDALGRKTKETDPNGHYTRWLYDLADGTGPLAGSGEGFGSRSYCVEIPEGQPVHNEVTLRFEMHAVPGPPPTYSWGLLSQIVTQYDIRGLVCQVTDANQQTTAFEYDAARRRTAATDPLGTRTEYEYDAVGNLVAASVTGDDGTATTRLLSRTEYAYNLRRERIAETRCLLDDDGSVKERRTTALAIDANGNPEGRIDAAGQVWWTYYDALNRPIGSTDPAGASPMRSYDARGNLQYTLDALDNLTEYQYDKRNLLTKTVDPAEHQVGHEYDALGRRTRSRVVRDPEYPATDIKTRTSYDAFGAPETVTEAEDAATNVESAVTYARDAVGQVTSVTAPQNDTQNYTASFTYDGASRKVADIDADNAQTARTYDAAGNLVGVTRRDDTVITRTFDALGRVTSVSANGDLVQVFEYDGLGRLVSATDYNGPAADHTVEYTYNSLNEMVSEAQDGYEVGLTYDQRSAPVSVQYPSGAGLAIARDARGLPTSFRYNPSGSGAAGDEVASVTYDLDGRLVGVALGNSIALSREFDPRSLETHRTYAVGTTEVLGVATSNYDERGNAQSEVVTGTVAAGARTSRTFEYDERSRLVSCTGTDSATWTLDKLGNWTVTTQNGGTENRSVNPDNEYKVGAESSCDINGNRASQDGLTFTYDWADRLVAVSSGSTTLATYTYDALDRRVTKTVGSLTTRYVYSGSQAIEEYEGTTLTRRFVLGPGLDQPILMDKVAGTGSGLYYYLCNRQGSVIALTDAGGAVVESYSYSAFGKPRLFGFSGTEILPPCSALGNPYGFAGQRWDAESALWYCRNRMYSPVLGRFLQRDPAGYVDGVNLYAYCRNNPLAFVDPWGLSAVGAQAGFGYVAAQTAIGFTQRWLQFQMAPINALSLIGEGALVAATDGSYQPRSPAFNSLVSGGVTAYTEGGQSAGDWYFRHQELGAVTGGVWTAGQAGYQITDGMFSGDIEQTGQGLVTAGTILGLGAFSLHMEAAVAAQAAGVAAETQAQTSGQAAWIRETSTPTGTVWDDIVPTQPRYEGSAIPRSFELTTQSGAQVWVAPNATEHVAEYAQMVARDYLPESVRLASQQELRSLQAAVDAAIGTGPVRYGVDISVGGWQLNFSPPRTAGQLPVLFHAQPQ